MEKATPDVELRPARLRDYLAIHRVRRGAAEKLNADFGKGEWSDISWFSTLERGLVDKTLYAIWMGQKIVGTCSLTTIPVSFYALKRFAQPNAAAFYLRSLSIHPDEQRKNIGRQAMKMAEAIATARRAASLRLDTLVAPAGATGFYQNCGYTAVYDDAGLRFFEKNLRAA